MTAEAELGLWLAAWTASIVVVYRGMIRRGTSTGLPLAIAVVLFLLHAPGAALYLLPWHQGQNPTEWVRAGTRVSALGAIALAIGALLARARPPSSSAAKLDGPVAPSVVAGWWREGQAYLAVGLLLYFALLPLVLGTASLTSVVASGLSLAMLGLGVLVFAAWKAGWRRRALRLLYASALAPVFTIVLSGYLGQGVQAIAFVFLFALGVVRPSRTLLVRALLLAYPALCLYSTYMEHRGPLREAVWGGASLSRRLDAALEAASNPVLFDPTRPDDLRRIDDRLNQNALVGAAVVHMTRAGVPHANGETLADALLAFIPRVVWPDKPLRAGSGDLVSRYTGLRFSTDTSVGIGLVLELYVNFGTPGVVIGFALLGVLAVEVDRRSSRALVTGQRRAFLCTHLPAMALLNVGGQLVESTSTAAGGYVLALVVTRAAGALERRGPRARADARPAAVGPRPQPC